MKTKSWLGRALMAVGISGAAVAALCCAAPLLLAGLITAVGLGFILKDSILIGLFIIFVALALIGYQLVRRSKQASS